MNTLDRATVLADNNTITVDDLLSEIVNGSDTHDEHILRVAHDTSRLDEIEKAHIIEILEREKGNKARAARSLGIHRRKLYRLLERFDLHKPELPTEG
jgi:transcriptional regulator of acetoin/glycerol metabolism